MTKPIPDRPPESGAFRFCVELAWFALWPIVWVIFQICYRFRVRGLEHIPRHGPALIVCNHVTWLDGFYLMFCIPRRIRFLVWTPYMKNPILGLLLKLGRAIPIAAEGGPRSIVNALREASQALADGELVGIFPEAALTRTGFMYPFQRGLEQILKRSPAPVIPTCLDEAWGSLLSYQGGRFFWKWPKKWPYPITVAFGQPLPPTSSSWQIRQAVQRLQAECFKRRREYQKPVHRLFVRMACRHPFRPCIIDAMPHGKELNYGMALTAGILLAKRLSPIVGDEKMLGILMPTTVGGALANIATAFLGKVAVNLNYTASKEAILSAIQQCGIKHVITARAFRTRLRLDLGPDVQLIDIEDIVGKVSKLERTITYLKVLCLPGWWLEYVTLGLGRHCVDDLATIIFSSGSTGDPKGVMLSHAAIRGNVASMLQAIDALPKERLLAVLPFFHSFGYTVTLWLPLVLGASSVYYPDPRQAKEIGEACKKWKCTLFVTTPTFLRFFIRRCEADDFKSLRLLITGAEKLPAPLAEEFAAKFGITPLEGYGCTELAPVACANVPNWEMPPYRQIGHKPGAVGQPIPGCAVKVVDPNDLQTELPPGETGMLLVTGPNVMDGYLHRPEATAEVLRDGWYVTGDLAQLDEDGFVRITDRLSRFSKIAGEMVPHQRIEDEIHQILNTSERVCAVTGVPDERKGERLVVLHTPLPGIDIPELHRRLANGGLPNLWLPGVKSFFQVPEIPILGSGKLDLQRVKKIALEKAGAEHE